MTISLRTRLTLWYSALLLLALVLFTATVLWLHWHLMVRQADDSLRALAIAAVNVVDAELAEHATLDEAAREMVGVVRQRNYEAAVLDASGTKLMGGVAAPLLVAFQQPGAGMRTVTGSDGRPWRLVLRSGGSGDARFTVLIAAPLAELEEQWRALVKACAIGVPFVMLIAAAGGWWLGQRGLRPLEALAHQARDITGRTPDKRLAVPGAGPELDAVASAFNLVLDRLGLALATQRRFMADASHELRTPVSILRTAAEVTLSQSGPRRAANIATRSPSPGSRARGWRGWSRTCWCWRGPTPAATRSSGRKSISTRSSSTASANSARPPPPRASVSRRRPEADQRRRRRDAAAAIDRQPAE